MNREEFPQELVPCIERSGLEICVQEAVRLAEELEVAADEMLNHSSEYEALGDHKQACVLALAAVQKGLNNTKKEAEAFFYAGFAADNFDRIRAEKYLVKSIELNGNCAKAHNSYALLLSRDNNIDEAKNHYEVALKIDPNYACAKNNYANLLRKMRDDKEAEKYYKQALDDDEDFATAHLNYALLLSNTTDRKLEAENHYKKAIEINQKAKEFNSDFALPHISYAMLLNEIGRKIEAEEQYKKAIEIDKNNFEAHLYYAQLLREKCRYYEARKVAEAAVRIKPHHPCAHATLGDIFANWGYFKEAEQEYKEALANFTSLGSKWKLIIEPHIHNNLGWVYEKDGRDSEAEKEFKEANPCENEIAQRNLSELREKKDFPRMFPRQKLIVVLLSVPLAATYILRLADKLTDNAFAVQSIFIIALMIMVLFFQYITQFKVGSVEFKMVERGYGSYELKMKEFNYLSPCKSV